MGRRRTERATEEAAELADREYRIALSSEVATFALIAARTVIARESVASSTE